MDCATSIRNASDEVKCKSMRYREVRGAGTAGPEVRETARQELASAYEIYQKRVLDSELLLLKRQESWDRLVYLLRGDVHVYEYRFDEFPQLDDFRGIPRGVFSWPM
jgi:hypothetical protein